MENLKVTPSSFIKRAPVEKYVVTSSESTNGNYIFPSYSHLLF